MSRRSTLQPRFTAPLPRHLALRSLVLSLALTTGLVTTTRPAQAQSAPAPAHRYAIAAGPLNQVLMRFLAESGVLLSGNTELTRDRHSPGVTGTHTPAMALAALLAGTGLEAVVDAQGRYTLRAAPAASPGVTTLPQVMVFGQTTRDDLTEGSGSYTTPASTAATGLNLLLKETPQSISVMTRQRLDDQQLNSLADVLEQTTGIMVFKQGPAIGGYQDIYARGYKLDTYQIDGLPSAVSAWGPAALGGGYLDTAIYDSITVVRGATGLLNGAGDPSASVSLTRKRPTPVFQAALEGSLGRWQQRRAVADLGGPLNAAGTLRGRLVAAHDEGKSWIARYEGNQQILYGVLDADLTEATILTAALEHGREHSNAYESGYGYPVVYAGFANTGIAVPTPFGRHDSSLPDWGEFDNRRTTASVGLEHQFSTDWRIKLNYSHTQRELQYRRGMVQGVNLDGTASRAMMIRDANKTRLDSFDVRVDGHYALFGRTHDVVAGLNGAIVKQDGRPDYYAIAILRNQVPIVEGVPQYTEPDWEALTTTNGSYATHKTTQSGFYLSTRLRPTDTLSLILGGRWSNWRHQAGAEPLGTVTDDRRYQHQFTPYLGIVQDLTSNLSAYASYTEIFNPQTVKDSSGTLLDPEEGRNYEIGLKGEWLDGRLNASIAAFNTRKENLAVLELNQFTPTGEQAYLAKDHTSTRGWELEVAGELTRDWQLQGGYTYTRSRDSDGVALWTDRPVHMLKLFTRYTPQHLPQLTLGGGIQWQSGIHLTAYDAYGGRDAATQKPFAVANLMLRYAFNDHLNLTLNLNNVFNAHYRITAGTHNYGPARNLYATLRYQF